MTHLCRLRCPLAVLTAIALMSIFAPLLTRADPMTTDPANAHLPPSPQHLLGTDAFGRDVWSRTLYGGRRTLAVALLGTLVAVVPGLLAGLAAGYRGGALDRLLMGLADALLAFPNLLLAMTLVALTEEGPWQIALAVGLAGAPAYARVARAAALEVRPALYITAARAVGGGWVQIVARHVLPNVMGTLVAFGAVTFSWSILNAAALNFLGLGGSISTPDWGIMLADARQAFRDAPWVGAAPGLAITATVLAAHALAEDWSRRKMLLGE
ncbi:MAG: ABC transporter permease [Anaerolineae bacterium]|nr:ABC transporter permease [Anaerolineae bacterium]